MAKWQFPPRVDVSDELREIVLDFMISCMLEQPRDLAEYGVEFFTKICEKRKTVRVYDYAKLESAYSEFTGPDECSEKELGYIMIDDDGEGEEMLEGEHLWASDWRLEMGADDVTTGDNEPGEGDPTTTTCEDITTATTITPAVPDKTEGETASESSVKVEPKGSQAGSPKESPKESLKGTPRQSQMGSPKGSPKQSQMGSPKGSPMGNPKESPKQSPKGTPKESPKQSPKGSPMGSPKGSPMGSPKGSPKTSTVASPKESPKTSPRMSATAT